MGTFDLLGGVWKGLPTAVARARGWGADWVAHSEAFVEVRHGQVVAHVGVMEIAATIDGREQVLAGIHAVCTHPEHRGQGLMRRTMDRALTWVDARYPSAVLWANDRAIYERFGFVARPESMFAFAPDGPSLNADASDARQLSLGVPDDLALVRSMLASRSPVSSLCGSREPGWLFLIDLALWGERAPIVAHVAALDCIAVYEINDGVLRLYDVVASRLPALAALVSHLGPGVREVTVFFGTDAFSDARSLPALPTSLYDFLMVRGAPLPAVVPLAFSPLSRC